MSFTFADVQAQCQARGFGSDSSAAQLLVLQSAFRRIVSKRRWKFLEASPVFVPTIIGTAGYDLTMDRVDRVYVLNGADSGPLSYLSSEDFEDLAAGDTQRAQPQHWTLSPRVGSLLRLSVWPIPDRIYSLQLDAFSILTAPTDTVTVVPLPDEFLDLLVFYLCAGIAARQKDWNAQRVWQQEYRDRLAELARSDKVRQRQTDDTVKLSGFYDRIS